MTRPFNPPAPEGYKVHEGEGCSQCVAALDDELCRELPSCTDVRRPDGRWVYFTRKPLEGEQNATSTSP